MRLFFCFIACCACAFGGYEAKTFPNLKDVIGLKQELISMHLELYKGYVNNTNALMDKITELSKQGPSLELSELRRRLGWEFDGMRLHELYFECLAPAVNIDLSSSLYKALEKQFQTFEAWKADFINAGKMRGIGWVILYYDRVSGSFINTWITEHDSGHLATSAPLLIMDVFEHAFITQYGLNRAAYIEAFFQNINWKIVEQRFSELPIQAKY